METHKGDSPSKYGRFTPNLVNRRNSTKETVINVNGMEIGAKEIVVIAGPCAVENKEQILETSKAVYSGGANILRAGAFKTRTSPYSFQGLGEEGLKLLKNLFIEEKYIGPPSSLAIPIVALHS